MDETGSMALLLLLTVGALIGWLASVVTRTEDLHRILTGVGTGSAVATIAGLLTNQGSVIGSLKGIALLVALAASVIALLALHVYRQRQTG